MTQQEVKKINFLTAHKIINSPIVVQQLNNFVRMPFQTATQQNYGAWRVAETQGNGSLG
jgi:hypothetical protein